MLLFKYLQKNKWISRRDFLDMLKEKVIFLNGEIIEDFNVQVKSDDKIEIKLPNGQIYEEIVDLSSKTKFPPVIVLFNKPKGYVVSKEDKYNKTIYELLPSSWRKDFYYIWRLDKNSHWLLLLTNKPELVDFFSNPKNKIFKIYKVKINKPFTTSHIKIAKKGIWVSQQWNKLDRSIQDADFLSFHDVKYTKCNDGHFLKIVLAEWKKRHIRRLLKALWYKVLDLKREKFWPYKLGNIKPWKWKIEKILVKI